jgi:hypothetical protein
VPDSTPQLPPIPAGWYADPAGFGQRYWDGSAWTSEVTPPPQQAQFAQPQFAQPYPAYQPYYQAQPAKPASAGDWIGGVLLAFLIPIAGLIAGIVYLTKEGPRRQVGLVTVILSVVAFLFWLSVMSAGGQQSTY